MAVIEGPDYETSRQRLANDPVVIEMAEEMKADPNLNKVLATLTHDDGKPNFKFIQAANREYERRGGRGADFIGDIATVILRLING